MLFAQLGESLRRKETECGLWVCCGFWGVGHESAHHTLCSSEKVGMFFHYVLLWCLVLWRIDVLVNHLYVLIFIMSYASLSLL